jgi:hypothetical protein
MIKRLSLQGASDGDVSALRDLMVQAKPSLHSAWKFNTGGDAGLLVIDIDTVYGHMDWLRAHSTGNPVAVLTEHTQFSDADLILHKPLTLANVVEVLNRADPDVQASPGSESVSVEPPPAPSRPAAVTAPAAAVPAPIAAPAPEPIRERRLSDWLVEGALSAAVRVRADGAPDLVLDPAERAFHAEASLRALAPYCSRTFTREDWQGVDAADMTSIQAAGKMQPYARLLWLCHALGSNGQLNAQLDLNAKYKLARWPQIEREFPKHFRIATVMLKQPATLTEIAEQSGASLSDVIDFTNAYNATGYIEIEAAVTKNDAPSRDSGRGAILSRLRNPFGGG